MNILGIDPGLRACGVAEQTRTGAAAWTIRPKTRTLTERIQEILPRIYRGPWDLVVIEKPQIYQGHLQKGDPNDLIDLAVLVGAIIGHVSATKILLPLPAEWKGQVPKDIHHRRIRKRVPGLGRCSKDALDAVGLYLYGVDHYA
jgi:hypothetical protein